MRNRCIPLRPVAATVLAFAASTAQPGELIAQDTARVDVATLYDRLGRYDFLARFVDTAFPRVASDPQLTRLFRGHSVDSQMRQRQLIVDALCHYTGGPCIYIGRDLRTVHIGLDITEQDWSAFMSIITDTLNELHVPAETRADFVRLFDDRLRPVVVVRSP